MFDKRFSESNLSICGCFKIYHHNIGTFIMMKVVEIPILTEYISTEKVNGILDLIII